MNSSKCSVKRSSTSSQHCSSSPSTQDNPLINLTKMTLVETVSFSTSDFTDNFLTCPTCLAGFNDSEKAPKLLPCSHTVCRDCLEQIVRQQRLPSEEHDGSLSVHQASGSSAEAFRCPVCRKAILLPRGGLNSLPPSYIVNRLMDLIKHKKQRDFIPKCKTHSYESLLFCETCDCIFCPLCDNTHHQRRSASDHIVVPFATALKRMTEILHYKCAQCRCSLDDATGSIRTEMERLDQSVEAARNAIKNSFKEIMNHVEQRRDQLIDSLNMLKQQKMQALAEQLKLVGNERSKIDVEWIELETNPDIRAMSAEIERLNGRLDTCQLLSEPRENSFLRFEFRHNNALCDLSHAISSFGRLRVSNTYPPLCTAKIDGNVCGVTCSVHVTAIDYNGNVQNVGGDPLSVSVTNPKGESIPYQLSDSLTGSYKIAFLPQCSGRYRIDVRIFNRPIHGSPLEVHISDHNNPIWKERSPNLISMPTAICLLNSSILLVLSTGNRKLLKISTETGDIIEDIKLTEKLTYSTIGLCLCSQTAYILDWRSSSKLTSLTLSANGDVLEQRLIEVQCDFIEPVMITSGQTWDTLPASRSYPFNLFIYDSALNAINVLGPEGQFIRTLPTDPHYVRCICTLPTTASILFSSKRGIYFLDPDASIPQLISDQTCTFTSMFCPSDCELIGARSLRDENRCLIEVYELCVQTNASNAEINTARCLKLQHCIDSFSFPLHCPSSMCSDSDGHLFCSDLTNSTVNKYRYE
ncbi:hypothetical protein ACOME3_001706 [Neoechinorhynchus agilis]